MFNIISSIQKKYQFLNLGEEDFLYMLNEILENRKIEDTRESLNNKRTY